MGKDTQDIYKWFCQYYLMSSGIPELKLLQVAMCDGQTAVSADRPTDKLAVLIRFDRI